MCHGNCGPDNLRSYMSTILCLEDFTCAVAEAAHVLRDNGYEVLFADDTPGWSRWPRIRNWMRCS